MVGGWVGGWAHISVALGATPVYPHKPAELLLRGEYPLRPLMSHGGMLGPDHHPRASRITWCVAPCTLRCPLEEASRRPAAPQAAQGRVGQPLARARHPPCAASSPSSSLSSLSLRSSTASGMSRCSTCGGQGVGTVWIGLRWGWGLAWEWGWGLGLRIGGAGQAAVQAGRTEVEASRDTAMDS